MTDEPNESPQRDADPAAESGPDLERETPEDQPGSSADDTSSPGDAGSGAAQQQATATPAPAAPCGAGPAPVPGAIPYAARPAPALFDDFWPEPDTARAPAALFAALIGGAGVAACVPFGRPGLGWPLLGLLIAGGLFLVGRKAQQKVHMRQIMWGVIGLLLLTVCAVRASEWLATLCVLSAYVTGMLAVTGGRSLPVFAMTAVTPVAAVRALPWVVRGTREKRRTSGGMRLAATIVVSLLLLLVFGALFAGADQNFADLVSAITPTLSVELFVRCTFVFVPCTLGCLGAAFALSRTPQVTEPSDAPKTLRRTEWALPVSVLVALFASFIAVQGAPLFGGDEHVQNTASLTYAGYARGGFWQLTTVTILTLLVIGAAFRWAPKGSRFDRNLLRGLGGALAVLTLVIVASSLVRMSAYQNAYGFTVMRLLVQSCELWLGVVYLLVIAAGVRLRARWLPSAMLGTAMAALLVLAAVNPDELIAERNVARFQATGKLDERYLRDLSVDAVPALRKLPPEERDELVDYVSIGRHHTGWRSWNLSWERFYAQS